ncbi:hypothetical protein [Novipirellula rosea]|uniref:hypothetical protein n=1 Tax=Novipirellula rosea TaxID=1031540 RepID=UPI0031EDDBCB
MPGRDIRLPENIVGKTNQDIDGMEVRWDFLKSHAREPEPHNASVDDAADG